MVALWLVQLFLIGFAFGTPISKKGKINSKRTKFVDNLSTDVPDAFDAREKWPQCKDVIGNVNVQGNCSASWAFAVTDSFRDRRCITGISSDPISAYDLLGCCNDCQNESGNGCAGGDISQAFQYTIYNGLVTGGSYHSGEGCKPWPFSAVGPAITATKCVEKCQYPYKKSYSDDLVSFDGQKIFQLSNTKVMEEIQRNGPVVVEFDLYEDFLFYMGGIYHHRDGQYLGKHNAKIIGWGIERNQSFWLAVNNFGFNWGEEGLFRIAKEKNECNFEAFVMAGIVSH